MISFLHTLFRSANPCLFIFTSLLPIFLFSLSRPPTTTSHRRIPRASPHKHHVHILRQTQRERRKSVLKPARVRAVLRQRPLPLAQQHAQQRAHLVEREVARGALARAEGEGPAGG